MQVHQSTRAPEVKEVRGTEYVVRGEEKNRNINTNGIPTQTSFALNDNSELTSSPLNLFFGGYHDLKIIFSLLILICGVFPTAASLRQAKIYYNSGKISSAYEELNQLYNKNSDLEIKIWYARVLSELGIYTKANEILLSIDPIKNQEDIGILFLKNLYRWQMFPQAKLYLEKIYLDNYKYFEVSGDIYFMLRNYKRAIEKYQRALTFQVDYDLIIYKIAKTYFKMKDTENAKKYIEKGLTVTKNRLMKLNLRRLNELL